MLAIFYADFSNISDLNQFISTNDVKKENIINVESIKDSFRLWYNVTIF